MPPGIVKEKAPGPGEGSRLPGAGGPGICVKNACQTFFWLLYFPSEHTRAHIFMKMGVRTIGEILFSRDHLWIKMDDDIRATLGVTDYFQEKMGEIYSLRLPEEGEELIKEEAFGVLEAKNGRRELTAPISGEVVEINYEALEVPEIINDDPWLEGWLIKIEMPAGQEFDDLLTEEEYEDYLSEEELEEE